MLVEIWSDIACPWCYIGKRRFEQALAEFDHADDVQVIWRSFELDPSAPDEVAGERAARLAAKYGMSVEQAREAEQRMVDTAAAEGLDFRFDSPAPAGRSMLTASCISRMSTASATRRRSGCFAPTSPRAS